MAYVPGFRYDLFLSYGSPDNVDGWVERFQSQLTGELSRLLGRPFSEKTVYFDKLRLNVGQVYPEELDEAARSSAIMVALLSASYVTSDWCSRERRVFRENLSRDTSFAERLAAVRVRPTGPLPDVLRDAQCEDFVVAGFQEPWPAGSGKWLEAVNRLATGLMYALQKLRNRTGKVFVGTTLSSHMELRASLVDYLSEQHFRATPDPPALLDDRAACQQTLVESTCAVHFIGGASDRALEAIEDSIQHCAGPTVLFQPFGAKLSAAEEDFLEALTAEHYPHRVGPNETELKKFLGDLLTRTRKAARATPACLGLICEPVDFPWAEQFRPEGLSVSYPRFLQEKLSVTDRIRSWRQMVRDSHGLLFYNGRSQETLLERVWRLAEEEQSHAIRRWFLDNPDVEAKRHRRPADPTFPDGLSEFLADVRRKAGES